MHKKGQQPSAAGNIAALIALIALFLIGYIILIPPEEREKLLGEDGNGVNNRGDRNNGVIESRVLLQDSPGLVNTFKDDSVKHKLSPVELFTRGEPEVDNLASSLSISRTLFADNMKTIDFNIDDTENLQDINLFFFVREAKGKLIIELNGNEVLNQEIEENQIKNIILPRSLIKKGNTLKFSTDFKWFSSNEYELEDVRLRKEFSLNNVEETRNFVLSESEIKLADRARLNYFVTCSKKIDNAVLTINLNDKPFERIDLPCIGDEASFDIDLDDLREGSNQFKFSIDNGDFRFSDLEVIIELEGREFPTFNFAVDQDEVDAINDNNLEARLTMIFIDDGKRKEAELLINNNKIFLDTNDDKYEKDVSRLLEEGSNKLQIIPKNSFEIIDLTIELVET